MHILFLHVPGYAIYVGLFYLSFCSCLAASAFLWYHTRGLVQGSGQAQYISKISSNIDTENSLFHQALSLKEKSD